MSGAFIRQALISNRLCAMDTTTKNIKTITFGTSVVPYTLKRSARARSIRIRIEPGGAIIVAAPFFALPFHIESILQRKADWILEKWAEMKKYPARIVLSPAERKAAKARAEQHFKDYKEPARALVTARLAHFNQFYGFKYGAIRIGRAKTRWGSCSRRGTLSFHYKVATLAPELADYLVVHELCHLGEFNHSPRFWALVARTLPNYKDLRKRLKEEGRVVG